MQVLNKKERILSFLFFLLIFSMTTGLILLAVFFDFQIPQRELEFLRERDRKVQEELEFQKRFAVRLETLKSFTDSLGMPGQDSYYNKQRAINEIITMQNFIEEEYKNLKMNNMYDNILLARRQLVDAKQTISTLGDSKRELDKLQAELDIYKEQLELVKRDLEVCRQINRSY